MSAPAVVSREDRGVYLLEDPEARARGTLVAFGDRRGGVSRPPYDSLNLSERSGDAAGHVAENRARAARAAGFGVDALALARQVHGAELREIDPGTSGVVGTADGLIARTAGPVLGILTADCAPVVVLGERGIALLHAGWRGLVAGIVERGVDAIEPARAAWVGPSIKACCYRVGRDVLDAFHDRGLPVAGDDRVDPAAAAVFALRRAGLSSVAAVDECTCCCPHFFSYRRDGVTGRQGAFAALIEAA